MRNITSHAQRYLPINPVHTTTIPTRILAREENPTACHKGSLYAALLKNAGTRNNRAIVNSRLETKIGSRRILIGLILSFLSTSYPTGLVTDITGNIHH